MPPRLNLRLLPRVYRKPSCGISFAYFQQSLPKFGRKHSSSNDRKLSALETQTGGSGGLQNNAFSHMNVFGSVPIPGSGVETIYLDGFTLSNGVRFRDGSGIFLLHNEAFKWRPTEKGSPVEIKAIRTGQLELGEAFWGILDVVYPKPELLIIGTGRRTLQLSKIDRDVISEMGIRIDTMDTSHAAAQYNLLATERPDGQVAAAMLIESFGIE